MFDQVQPPNNLPVEPDIKAPPASARAPASPDSRMKGGIMPPARHEPEDILSSIPSESMDAQAVPASMPVSSPSGGDKKLKGVMIALIVVAVVLVVAIGGLFVYRTYFMKTEEMPLNNAVLPVSNTNQQPTEARNQAPGPSPIENPPIVAPTPEPDIPKPTNVSSTNAMQIDTDGDGLSDERELGLKTDPSNADTDGDKLSDGDEVSMGTDPLVADTDGDGLPDGDEVHVRKTDPKNKDTDGDGFSDGEEIRNGYNPLGAGKLSDFR